MSVIDVRPPTYHDYVPLVSEEDIVRYGSERLAHRVVAFEAELERVDKGDRIAAHLIEILMGDAGVRFYVQETYPRLSVNY